MFSKSLTRTSNTVFKPKEFNDDNNEFDGKSSTSNKSYKRGKTEDIWAAGATLYYFATGIMPA